MKEETIWLADYEFSGRVPNSGHVAAVAVCTAMEISQVFSLTDSVIGEALRILDGDWDRECLLKILENCSFSKSEEVPL